MNQPTLRTILTWLAPYLAALLTLAAGAAYGQDAITITQVDPSGFPEMVVYIDAEASKLAAGLTAEDFTVAEDGEEAQIVDFAGEGEARPVDIVFVFDTTSSMGEEIDGAIASSVAFVEQLRAANRDVRLGLVAFGDEIRAIQNGDLSLTADVTEFTNWVRQLRAEGGGDDPEASLEALEQATALQFRPDAQRVLLLITDAPPHEAGDGTPYARLTASELANTLRDGGFVVYAVAAADPRFMTVVNETGGKFYALTRRGDFEGLIDAIGGEIAKQYRLTYLSPRSSYDGTRRNIVVSVGGQTGAEEFLEPHLINIQSSLPIGLGLLAVLLGALAAPTLRGRWSAGRAGRSTPASAPAVSMPAVSAPACPACGRALRPGARFCGGCGAQAPAA